MHASHTAGAPAPPLKTRSLVHPVPRHPSAPQRARPPACVALDPLQPQHTHPQSSTCTTAPTTGPHRAHTAHTRPTHLHPEPLQRQQPLLLPHASMRQRHRTRLQGRITGQGGTGQSSARVAWRRVGPGFANPCVPGTPKAGDPQARGYPQVERHSPGMARDPTHAQPCTDQTITPLHPRSTAPVHRHPFSQSWPCPAPRAQPPTSTPPPSQAPTAPRTAYMHAHLVSTPL